jgi:hypothetical protein
MWPKKLIINFDRFAALNWEFKLDESPLKFKSPRMSKWGFFEPFFDGYDDESLVRAEIKFILADKGRQIDEASQSVKSEILNDFAILLHRNAEIPTDIEFTTKVRFAQ